MPLEKPDSTTVALDELVPATPPASAPQPGGTLKTTVKLVAGMLSFREADGTRHSCLFQFNPTELERSRTVKITRSPTGNTREEPKEGPRNQAKRKFTGKPDPWTISLSLRYDASYHNNPEADTGTYKHRVQRIDEALSFFESLGEPGPFVSENEKPGNADETPQTPRVDLTYGLRQWRCTVTSVRIKELEYTPDLFPRRFEVTLALEAIETVRNGIDRKPGAKR